MLNIDEKIYQQVSGNLQEFDPLPDGNYVVVVEESEVRENKSGNGYHLALKLRVQGGPYRNRIIFLNQGLTNNPISLRHLKNVLDACDYKHSVNELDQYASTLLDKVVVAKVTHSKGEEKVALSQITPDLLERIQATTMQVAAENKIEKERVVEWLENKYGIRVNAASWIAAKEAILAGEFRVTKADKDNFNEETEEEEYYF